MVDASQDPVGERIRGGALSGARIASSRWKEASKPALGVNHAVSQGLMDTYAAKDPSWWLAEQA